MLLTNDRARIGGRKMQQAKCTIIGVSAPTKYVHLIIYYSFIHRYYLLMTLFFKFCLFLNHGNKIAFNGNACISLLLTAYTSIQCISFVKKLDCSRVVESFS